MGNVKQVCFLTFGGLMAAMTHGAQVEVAPTTDCPNGEILVTEVYVDMERFTLEEAIVAAQQLWSGGAIRTTDECDDGLQAEPIESEDDQVSSLATSDMAADCEDIQTEFVPAGHATANPPPILHHAGSAGVMLASSMRQTSGIRKTTKLTGKPFTDDRGFPTTAALRELPTRACVAFGARCARRIIPIYRVAWPTAPIEMVKLMEQAVRCAEDIPRTPFGELAEAYQNAPRAANAAVYQFGPTHRRFPAEEVAMAVVHCVGAAINEPNNDPILDVASVLDAVHRSMRDLSDGDRQRVLDAIQRDFEIVRPADLRDGSREGKPVRAERFGPLWPTGAPNGWQVAQRN